MADNDPKQQEAARKVEEYIEKIHYSERYSDDEYEYRHVILPKPLFKMIPKTLFNADNTGTLRLLSEEEWRGIGITQSLGWEHYEVHAPEPHVLLFRRPKNFDQMHAAKAAAAMNGRAGGGGGGRMMAAAPMNGQAGGGGRMMVGKRGV